MTFEGYFGYPAGRGNYLTNLSLRHRAAFVEVPKAGCTTVKKVMQYSEVDGDVSKMPADVHDRRESPLPMLRDLDLRIDDVFGPNSTFFRFCFVRNPYTRALSCYKDKIVTNQWERERRLPDLGFKPTDEVSFEQFLTRVAMQPLRKMDIHWAPQSFLLGVDRVSYHFIGRQETFAADMQRVIDHLGMKSPEGAVSQLPRHATGARASLREYYTDETADLVRRIYARDFATFGYGIGLDLA